MLIIGRLYRTYEAAVVSALSLNEFQWDAAALSSLITRFSRNNIRRMARGKSLSLSPQNTDSLPRQREKPKRFLNPEWMMNDTLQRPQHKYLFGSSKRCYRTNILYTAMQSWPSVFILACVKYVSVLLLFLCFFPSRWWRAAAGALQATVYFTTLNQGWSEPLVLLTVHC